MPSRLPTPWPRCRARWRGSADARFAAAYGAAFAPDPSGPPPWFYYPFTDPGGPADPSAWAQWEGGFGGLAVSVEDAREELLALRGIAIDVGINDEYAWIPVGPSTSIPSSTVLASRTGSSDIRVAMDRSDLGLVESCGPSSPRFSE